MREPLLGAACGKKGSGKSYETFGMMLDYVSGKYGAGGVVEVAPRRVLILDVNDEYGHVEYNNLVYQIKSISRDDVQKFSVHPNVEIRRIRPFNNDGTKWTLNEIADTLYYILDYYRGGLLLIEDINRYVSDSLPNDLIGAICTNRHTDLDIIAHFQSIGRLTPKFWQNLNWVRLHKNADSIEKHKSKAEDKYKIVKIAENMVNQQYMSGNERFHTYIDLDKERIRGNYSVQMLHDAVVPYLIHNKASIVKPYIEIQKTIKAEYSDAGMNPRQKKELESKIMEQLVQETMEECCMEEMIA